MDTVSDVQFENFLRRAVEAVVEAADDVIGGGGAVQTFEEAGVLTYNRGLVVRVGEAEFQVTIVRSA